MNRTRNRTRRKPIQLRQSNVKPISARLNRFYDKVMYAPSVDRLYENSDFHNLGYWKPGTRTQKEACENLMDKLIGFIPEPGGTLLDVACGKGASTRYLSRFYAAKNITGINITEKAARTLPCECPGLQVPAYGRDEAGFR